MEKTDTCFEGIVELTTGQQAALKRSAGKTLDEVDAFALQSFFTAVLPQNRYDQEKAFAVACIVCLWKPEERVSPKPFASCLGMLRKSKGGETKGLDSRFRSLIDTDWNDGDGYLAVKLVRLARMLKQSGTGYPDPESLFKDLKYWNHPDRFVQRRWMEQYLSTNETQPEENQIQEEE